MPSTLTITSTDFTTFTSGTKIIASEIVNNFEIKRGHLIPLDGSLSASDSTKAYQIGSSDYRFKSLHASPYMDQTTVSTTYTATIKDDYIFASNTGGAYTITLPTAVGLKGKSFYIKNIGPTVGAVTIDGNGSETIDGSLTMALYGNNDSVQLLSDGSNFHTLNKTISEYKSVELTEETRIDAVLNTFIDVTGAALTLEPGLWHIGYQFSLREESTLGLQNVYGNLRIVNGSNVAVDGSVMGVNNITSSAHTACTFPIHKSIQVDVSSTSVYQVEFRHNTATTGTSSTVVVDTSLSLTGDQVSSLFFARRVPT